MAQNAENFAPNIVYLDPDAENFSEGILRIRLVGDLYDRVQIHLDGLVYVGDGTAAPELPAALTAADIPAEGENGSDVQAILDDFEARIAVLEP